MITRCGLFFDCGLDTFSPIVCLENEEPRAGEERPLWSCQVGSAGPALLWAAFLQCRFAGMVTLRGGRGQFLVCKRHLQHALVLHLTVDVPEPGAAPAALDRVPSGAPACWAEARKSNRNEMDAPLFNGTPA